MRRRTRTRTRCSLLLSFVALLGSGSSRWGNDSRGNVWGVGPRLGDACGIAGYDSGECVDYNPEFYEPRLSFCKGSVKYRACLPKANDNFPNHSISMKDDWVRDTFDEIVAERIAAEQNTNYLQNQVNEYGDPGVVVQRFSDPNGYFENCKDALQAYMCFMNFPRCDEQEKSLVLCKSVCQNLMDTCHIPYDLQRCGPPEWHNGNEPEEMLFYNDAGSYPILMRDFFPGQPFRENQYETPAEKQPKIVCTPSLPGAAGRPSGPGLAAVAFSIIAGIVALAGPTQTLL